MPAVADFSPRAEWNTMMVTGYVTLARVSSDQCLRTLPKLMGALMDSLLSEKKALASNSTTGLKVCAGGRQWNLHVWGFCLLSRARSALVPDGSHSDLEPVSDAN